jgi:hypothetical protein
MRTVALDLLPTVNPTDVLPLHIDQTYLTLKVPYRYTAYRYLWYPTQIPYQYGEFVTSSS